MVVCFLFLAATSSLAEDRACSPPQAMRDGWNASFVAGCVDRNGRFAGGSQVMHLVPHKGRLYAATGYWMDGHSLWYGGGNSNSGWAQVLALSGPAEAWSVDL
ncbi:MAG: hypothetical protein JO128_17260, partial [Alphaproteobacteria bacterium]|nr:hypothetical protein [Alphaproteobacteria bacterium]